ncbi:MAG: cytochrome P450 [Nocardiopsaceae bacterium]|nr:cytochrome P450 [Nocardiopsaceae bacterium]
MARRVLREGRSTVYWGATHGLPQLVVRRAARRGDLQGRLTLAGAGGGGVDAVIEEIRAAGPLAQGAFGGVTVDHAVVREVLTSNDFRSGSPVGTTFLARVAQATRPDVLSPLEPPSLLVTEPPEHTRYRKLVTRVFTARAVERLRERTEKIAVELLDDLEARRPDGRPADLVAAYCGLLPVTVISAILGVAEGDRRRVLELGEGAAPSLDFGLGWGTYRKVARDIREFDSWLTGHISYLRRNPGEDLLSQLIQARDDQGALTELELKSTAGLVLAAGFETTVNLLGNGIKLLHDHPGQLARLRADPGLWPNAVDEVLRVDSPVLLTGRVAARATEVAGTTLPAGSFVTTILAGANRDPNVFDDPGRFDVTRPNARDHVSFSLGRHHCLGASLARMEGAVGLRALFDRYPGLTLLPGARRRPTRILRGWETLPARLEA